MSTLTILKLGNMISIVSDKPQSSERRERCRETSLGKGRSTQTEKE